MPLTDKGKEIINNMHAKYGKKKGDAVFYASKNAGKITGIDHAKKIASELRRKNG
jgi:hypothetical protein